MRIHDSELAAAYATLSQRLAAEPGLVVEGDALLDLLAAVGDRWFAWQGSVRRELAAAKSTAEQIAIVQRGMSGREKQDLATILDEGTLPLSAAARALLCEIIGRPTPQPAPMPYRPPTPASNAVLQVALDMKDGVRGTATPGVCIEAVNLTTAPGGRVHTDETFTLGTADASGKFVGGRSGALADLQEGDILRLRARDAAGKTSDWVTVQAHGLAARDTRNAVLSLPRIALVADGAGTVEVANLNEGRQISEPGATLEFVNRRSGAKTRLTLNDEGTFAAGGKLVGEPGDVFSVAVSDGYHNLDFATLEGQLTVPKAHGGGGAGDIDLPDPALHNKQLSKEGKPLFESKRFCGELFVDGVSCEDPVQGQIGDCYFPAAMAALAKQRPDLIEKMIKANSRGTYSVTFKDYDPRTRSYRDVEVEVDGDLYVRPYGGPLYGASNGARSPDKMELWFPLIEKAFAKWKGSYDAIGSGGAAGEVFEACAGWRARYVTISENRADDVWRALMAALDAKLPVAMGTHGEDEGGRYHNSGVYPDHAYSVLDCKVEGGQRLVQLRNPWGESEPTGDGSNDGVFWMDIEKVCHLYSSFYSVSV